MEWQVTPLELCVALGFLNTSVLEAQDEDEALDHPVDRHPVRDDDRRVEEVT